MTLHLIQPRELYGPPERQAELSEAWRLNDAIFDITTPTEHLTFGELFALCKDGCVNVIANSDIYFDHTLREHADRIEEDHIWALSRYEDMGATLLPYHRSDSQDAWVIRGGPHYVTAPYAMGVPGCDNAIAYELHAMGWDVTNPCQTVRAIHLHKSGYRTYGDGRGKPKAYSVPPPYLKVTPCSL